MFGGIHGREGGSIMATLDFAALLLSKLRAHDKHTEVVLSHSMVWMIPSLNPDTYDLNIRQFQKTKRYGMKRKNQHPVCSKSRYPCYCFSLTPSRYMDNGIDLNRNFPVCFDIDNEGSSPDACSEIYRVVKQK